MEEQDLNIGEYTLILVVCELIVIMLFRLWGFRWLDPPAEVSSFVSGLLSVLLCIGMGVAGLILLVCALWWLTITVTCAWHREFVMMQGSCAIALLSILLPMQVVWLIPLSATSANEKNPQEEASLASSLKYFSLGTSFSPVHDRDLDELQGVVILDGRHAISDYHWFVPEHRRAQSIDEAMVVVCLSRGSTEHAIYNMRQGGQSYKLMVPCYTVDAYFLQEGLTQNKYIARTHGREGWPNVQAVRESSDEAAQRELKSTLGLCYSKWDEAGFFYPEKSLYSSLRGSPGHDKRVFAAVIVTTLVGLVTMALSFLLQSRKWPREKRQLLFEFKM